MLQEIFWYIGIKRQHDIQKEQGAAGLIALLATFFIIWKWEDIFFPILKATGLVEIAEKGGLIDNSGFSNLQTYINIFVFTMFILICIGIISAIPMMVFLLAIKGTTNTTLGNIVFMLIGVILLPFVIIIYPFSWIGKKLGLVSEVNDIHTYVKNNSHLSSKEIKAVAKHDYLSIFARQESAKNNFIDVNPISLDEAKRYLNYCVKDFESAPRTLIGYKQSNNAWFILYPSPIPKHMSTTLHDFWRNNTGAQSDPLHVISLSNSFAYLAEEGIPVDRKDFYVPAEACAVYYDVGKKKMVFEESHSTSYLINLTELDYIYTFEGKFAESVVTKGVRHNYLLKTCMRTAIGLSYYIPLMYLENELYRFRTNSKGSYYRALKGIEGAYEHASKHKDCVIEVAAKMATDSHFVDGKKVYNNIISNEINQSIFNK